MAAENNIISGVTSPEEAQPSAQAQDPADVTLPADVPSAAEADSIILENQPHPNHYKASVSPAHVPYYYRRSPLAMWSADADIPDYDPARPGEQLDAIRDTIIDDQPYHFAAHPKYKGLTVPTFGPLTLPESYEPDDLTSEQLQAQPIPRYWSPDASAEQLLQGAAKDLATLASLLAARTINATGFQPDQDTIKHFAEIANGLRNVTYVLRETKPRRGRPAAKTIQTGQTKRRRKDQPKENNTADALPDESQSS